MIDVLEYISENDATSRSNAIAVEQGVSADCTTQYWFEVLKHNSLNEWVMVVRDTSVLTAPEQAAVVSVDETNYTNIL